MKKIIIMFIGVLCIFGLASCGNSSVSTTQLDGTSSLGNPNNLVLNDTTGVIKWNSVKGASGYKVNVNGKTFEVDETSYTISLNDFAGEYIVVKVMAISSEANVKNSEYSKEEVKLMPGGPSFEEVVEELKLLSLTEEQAKSVIEAAKTNYVSNNRIVNIVNKVLTNESSSIDDILSLINEFELVGSQAVGFVVDLFIAIGEDFPELFENHDVTKYIAFIEENRDDIVAALLTYYDVIAFAGSSDFNDLILSIASLAQSDFTAAEILVVKNQISNYLDEFIPTKEELDVLGTVLKKVVSTFNEDLKISSDDVLEIQKSIEAEIECLNSTLTIIKKTIELIDLDVINEFIGLDDDERLYDNGLYYCAIMNINVRYLARVIKNPVIQAEMENLIVQGYNNKDSINKFASYFMNDTVYSQSSAGILETIINDNITLKTLLGSQEMSNKIFIAIAECEAFEYDTFITTIYNYYSDLDLSNQEVADIYQNLLCYLMTVIEVIEKDDYEDFTKFALGLLNDIVENAEELEIPESIVGVISGYVDTLNGKEAKVAEFMVSLVDVITTFEDNFDYKDFVDQASNGDLSDSEADKVIFDCIYKTLEKGDISTVTSSKIANLIDKAAALGLNGLDKETLTGLISFYLMSLNN